MSIPLKIQPMMQAVYEPEVANVFAHFVRPGDCVVDVGASIGCHIEQLASLVGPGGAVLAFEPHPQSFELLREKIAPFPNVACVQMALWSESIEAVALHSAPYLGYSSLIKYYDPFTADIVSARTLDSILVGRESPRVIKIDCEGAELDVLRGAEALLRAGVDAVVVEINMEILKCMNHSDRSIRDYMRSLGYDCYLISIGVENDLELLPPIKVLPHVELVLKGGHHINVLFSTDTKIAERWNNGSQL